MNLSSYEYDMKSNSIPLNLRGGEKKKKAKNIVKSKLLKKLLQDKTLKNKLNGVKKQRK